MPLSSLTVIVQLVPVADVPPARREHPLMSVMFILLPVALLFSAAALAVFIRAARAGQFDDLETPAPPHPPRRRVASPRAASREERDGDPR